MGQSFREGSAQRHQARAGLVELVGGGNQLGTAFEPALGADHGAPQAAISYDEAAFRYALNEDAMATEKLAEGIRGFAVDAAKLDKMIESLRQAA